MPLDLTRALEQMTLIRRYEEKLVELQASGAAPGTCTSVGQEASAVGVISALRSEDAIVTNHRSAAHLIARGAELKRLFAEVMGREDGYCRGKSGSLHISVEELGVLLTSTIVGGELGMVTGVALSRKMQGHKGIVVCFFGDGAASQGRFHESLNLAAVWELPILYICENNQWQAFVHRRETMVLDNIAQRASAYGVQSTTVDGNDVEAVYDAAVQASQSVRQNGKPFLLETRTYRLRGHNEPDDQSYVDPSELSHWKSRDPIFLLEHQLRKRAVINDAMLDRMQDSLQGAIDEAAAAAITSPYPAAGELLTHVYA